MYFPITVGAFKTINLKAVDDVSFAIKRGETLGLVGESGCGKTTLGRTILQLYTPTAGTIVFNGKEIVGKKALKEFRSKATVVFQDPYSSLNPRMTVMDIIGEPIDIHHTCDKEVDEQLKKMKEEHKGDKKFMLKYKFLRKKLIKEARNKRVLSLMSAVGLLPEQASRYAHSFSGGQRQRIGIARALASQPEFIVCDEPVSALDVSIQAQILNTFQELQKQLGLTYLFVAHNLLVVKHISDRIAVMYLGHIVELCASDVLYDKPLHPYTVSLLSAIPEPDPIKARSNKRQILEGEIPSPLHTPSGCPFRLRCPRAHDACEEERPHLVEIEKDHFVACHLYDKK